MRSSSVIFSILSFPLLTPCVQAQLIPFFAKPAAVPNALHQQDPMSNTPGIQLPPEPDHAPAVTPGDDTVVLSDVIGNFRTINIFAGFTREIASVSKRLDTTSLNTTVLAPLNSAIQNLPWKPWEDPRDYDLLGAKAYEGISGEDRAAVNLKRFAESHMVAANPWKEGEKLETMAGNTVWWEKKDGKAFVQPGNVEVERVAQKVANGEVWVLKGVVDYAS